VPVLDIEDVEGSERTLRLRGELDMLTAPGLLERMEPLCGSPGDVVLECAELSFVDSQGIRAFLRAARALPQGDLVLAHPTGEVRRLLDIVRVEDFPNTVVRD
jgi:anti-anti-sigma factor